MEQIKEAVYLINDERYLTFEKTVQESALPPTTR